MPSIGTLLKTAARLGPVAYPAVKKAVEVIKKNPELARTAQDLVDRFTKARAARSRPENLRRSVGVLRSQAQHLLSRADTPQEAARAQRWLLQADRVESAIGLIGIHSGKQQQRDAARIQKRIDELFGEILTATMEDAEEHQRGELGGPASA
ncbi:hypothetical protein [Georgenia faecalis]|uniref:Uncharacterized protein n=1 Tax=Georgenia faecalis TaxID=2483799 RepID=A0ABV9DCC8_9MICO|nr:hypothetical protein [Georgenia faecalis]